jgi:hypothetical protein
MTDLDSPRLAQLYFEPGELYLLLGLLRADVDTAQANLRLAQSEDIRTVLQARVVMAMSLHTAVSEAFFSVGPKITCPRCNETSYNPTDVLTGYCAQCEDHTGEPMS